jgi:hypothetical protein
MLFLYGSAERGDELIDNSGLDKLLATHTRRRGYAN